MLSTGASPPAMRKTFRELLQLFAQSARLEEAVAAMTETFVGKLTSLPHDSFAVVTPTESDWIRWWSESQGRFSGS